jgi:hypothetical protein
MIMPIRTGLKNTDKVRLVNLLRAGYSWPEAKAAMTGIDPAAVDGHKEWAVTEAKKPSPEARTAATTPRFTEDDLEDAKADAEVKAEAKFKEEIERLQKLNADLQKKVEFLDDGKPSKPGGK